MKSLLLIQTALLCLISPAMPVFADSKSPPDLARPTLVTLKLNNMPQQAVFDELARQAGLQFSTQPENLWDKRPGEPVTISLSNQPFWEAMRDVCGKSGISLKYAADSARPKIILARDNQDWVKYPTVTNGPFLVSLIGLYRAHTVDMRKPAETQKVFFAKFTVFCEPRIRLLRGPLYAKVEEAVDDKGHSMLPAKEKEQPLNYVATWAINLDGKLSYPKEPGGRIAKLRVSARFVAQTASETIEFADPLTEKNITKTVAGRKIIIKQIAREGDEYKATVTLVRGDVPAAEWEQTLFPGNTLQLIDGDAKSALARGFALGGKGDEATYVFRFDATRIHKPLKLSWEIPTKMREIPLTFEFKDLPLP